VSHDDLQSDADERDDDAGDGEPNEVPGRRLLRGFLPQGPFQIVVAVLAVCFLAGSIGYVIGTRNTFPTSAVDVGFLMDMSDHHDQAVAMSLCTANRATENVTREFAKETLVFQSHDLGVMQVWLEDQGKRRPTEDDRPTMAWMGMSSTRKTMPGMASDAEVDALCAATGRDIDRLFLTLMRNHHRGGVHMAEYAADHAASPRLRDFASVMAKNQAVEANEYTETLKRLGFE
jgi:uncharacterized protein (DUF305 family)